MSGLRRKASRTSAAAAKRFKQQQQSSGARYPSQIDLGWKESKTGENDDEIESDDEQFFGDQAEAGQEPSSDEEEETVEAKRVRMAREYLQKVEAAGASDESSSSEEDEEQGEVSMKDRISLKLQRERLKREGTLERAIADTVGNFLANFHKAMTFTPATPSIKSNLSPQVQAQRWIDAGRVQYFRGHDLTPTSVALTSNGERAISGSKDNSVILWDVQREKKLEYICRLWKKGEMQEPRGNGEALCVACSDDGRYAAVGRRDATVNIYDVRLSGKKQSTNLVQSFKGHKRPVTCLAFRTQSNQLFSGSDDRCIR